MNWIAPINSPQHKALTHIRHHSIAAPTVDHVALTINFHPDRLTADGAPLLLAMAGDGLLKSQFATGTSNGGLSAYAGGDRWKWEHRAFNGAYDECLPADRPKYGALDFRKKGSGGSPRFGSAYFVLKTELLTRTSFCFPDSYFDPSDFSSVDHVGRLLQLSQVADLDELDNYIEAHIHGPIRLPNDVEALMLDPVYKNTDVERYAVQLPCRLGWHSGFQLSIEDMEEFPDYRGARYIELAKTIAQNGCLNALLLGTAVNSGEHDPQDIKKIWHYLARYGDLNQSAFKGQYEPLHVALGDDRI